MVLDERIVRIVDRSKFNGRVIVDIFIGLFPAHAVCGDSLYGMDTFPCIVDHTLFHQRYDAVRQKFRVDA